MEGTSRLGPNTIPLAIWPDNRKTSIAMQDSRPIRLVIVTWAFLLLMPATALAAPGRNNTNAKLCQTSWQQLQGEESDIPFRNQGECVSYAARGGTLVPVVVPEEPTEPSIIAEMGKHTVSPLCIASINLSGFQPSTFYTVIPYSVFGEYSYKMEPEYQGGVTTDTYGNASLQSYSAEQQNFTVYFTVDGVDGIESSTVTFQCGW